MDENRIAIVAILINDPDSVAEVNSILHSYSSCIIGRMGIPYREKNVSIISIAMDAPGDMINAAAGALGKLSGVTAKAVYSKLP
ncbi:MAG: iron-only hydrogenase system regulator [Parasporobacterium sp.]|nr:iron-only hydrogenase system regulator [Parasporobacterium sp.]